MLALWLARSPFPAPLRLPRVLQVTPGLLSTTTASAAGSSPLCELVPQTVSCFQACRVAATHPGHRGAAGARFPRLAEGSLGSDILPESQMRTWTETSLLPVFLWTNVASLWAKVWRGGTGTHVLPSYLSSAFLHFLPFPVYLELPLVCMGGQGWASGFPLPLRQENMQGWIGNVCHGQGSEQAALCATHLPPGAYPLQALRHSWPCLANVWWDRGPLSEKLSTGERALGD